MESGEIPNNKVTASSQYSGHPPHKGRLNYYPAWAASSSNANQWLQIDLGGQYHTITRVTRVATQGHTSNGQWVTQYKLQFRDSGVSFQNYKEQGQTTPKVEVNKMNCLLRT